MKNKIKQIVYLLLNLFDIKVLDYRINCPIEEKREFIRNIQDMIKANIFIESGTYKGDTINYLKEDFDKLISIELSEKYYSEAIDRFKNTDKIKIIYGDSGEVMPDILSGSTNYSYLFWLDGHYSQGTTAKGNIDTPIFSELTAIFKSKISRHIILIDDARLFFGKNDYPSILKLRKFMNKNSSNRYTISIKKDIIILTLKNDQHNNITI